MLHKTEAIDRHHTRYRAHIDGLRAIAVLGVVAFHFGATQLPGGFLGVDIFFVISGFVISRSIYRETEAGNFSIFSFYERRIRRILPAFLVVTAATAAAAYLYLFPFPLQNFAASMMASVAFSGNIYFYKTSGYFSPTAIQLPLLHYWSLGVEEQFYLIFPLLVRLLFRRAGNWFPMVIFLLMAASFAACVQVRSTDPSAAFYLLPFRAFEILIGCALALKQMRFPSNPIVAATFSGAGIALCLYSFLGITEEMALPGALSLIPCMGAALIIIGGEKSETIPVRLLSSVPMLFIGRISYSLYLVHWPTAVFLNERFPEMDGAYVFIIGTLSSLLLAYLCYKFVEQPVRQSVDIFPPSRIFTVSAASSAMLLTIGLAAIATNGLPQRYSPTLQQIMKYQEYNYADLMRVETCFLRATQSPSELDVKNCYPPGVKRIVLWGDSSVAQYYWGLAPLMHEDGITLGQLTASACLPLLGYDTPTRPNCRQFNDFVLETLRKDRPDAIVIGGVWSTSPAELFALGETIRKLDSYGFKVILLGTPSYFKHQVSITLAQRRLSGNASNAPDGELREDISIDRDKVLRTYFAGNKNMGYVSIANDVCPTGCEIIRNNIPMHYDSMHLTKEGSQFYAPRIEAAILRELNG